MRNTLSSETTLEDVIILIHIFIQITSCRSFYTSEAFYMSLQEYINKIRKKYEKYMPEGITSWKLFWKLVNNLIRKPSSTEKTKEDIFCKLLCCELKELKCYYRGTINDSRSKSWRKKKNLFHQPSLLIMPCCCERSTLEDRRY